MSYYDDVRAHHEKMRFPIGERPTLPASLSAADHVKLILAAESLERHRDLLRTSDHPELFRAAFALEEHAEYLRAVADRDLVGIADGLADSVYVDLGTALVYGLPFEEVWAEVHRTNQTKDPDPNGGKAVKPPGWSPPDLRRVLRETP